MVHALDGDDGTVERAAAALSQTATKHGLGFWKAYADLFGVWALTRRSTGSVAPGRLEEVMDAVRKSQFDPGYSTLLADLLLNPSTSVSANEALSELTVGLAAKVLKDSHWGGPEFLRVQALLTSEVEQRSQAELANAFSLAQRQGAHAWQLRIGLDLANILIGQDQPREANALLDALLLSFPDGSHSRDWLAARDLRSADAVAALSS